MALIDHAAVDLQAAVPDVETGLAARIR